ncbi:2-vinyl bacteriochlorophyllide hydratase [Lichenicoccus sp.]|uniref:2-vinyl bacteriochlorophyllide hydratase n=1 Tax=Lichenicoccus sp. TaxID=2781899 RepID=UPI003D107B78
MGSTTTTSLGSAGGLAALKARTGSPPACRPLYTAEQRRRRDASVWTLVQGILAPLQFLVFLVSLGLVLHALVTGRGAQAANVSVLVKAAMLCAIMVTGAIWEHRVFGCYLLAPAFFWEDVASFGVIALHAAYVVALFGSWLDETGMLLLALAAYAAYLGNALQFLLKLRSARLAASA